MSTKRSLDSLIHIVEEDEDDPTEFKRSRIQEDVQTLLHPQKNDHIPTLIEATILSTSLWQIKKWLLQQCLRSNQNNLPRTTSALASALKRISSVKISVDSELLLWKLLQDRIFLINDEKLFVKNSEQLIHKEAAVLLPPDQLELQPDLERKAIEFVYSKIRRCIHSIQDNIPRSKPTMMRSISQLSLIKVEVDPKRLIQLLVDSQWIFEGPSSEKGVVKLEYHPLQQHLWILERLNSKIDNNNNNNNNNNITSPTNITTNSNYYSTRSLQINPSYPQNQHWNTNNNNNNNNNHKPLFQFTDKDYSQALEYWQSYYQYQYYSDYYNQLNMLPNSYDHAYTTNNDNENDNNHNKDNNNNSTNNTILDNNNNNQKNNNNDNNNYNNNDLTNMTKPS